MKNGKVTMNIAILMMQKNEEELLDKWIAYHSYLVGHQNLYIYDNGSTNKNTLTKLAEAQRSGVKVISQFASKKDYENRGDIFADKIKDLDSNADYDYYMLIDCDEFLASVDEEGIISCDRGALEKSLSAYLERSELLLIDSQFYNSSVSPRWFNKQPYRKCFFRRGTIKSLDQGFHWGQVNSSQGELRTNLVHLHFHNKPFELAKKYAKEKLEGRVSSFDIEYLKSYEGKGFHLVRFFLESESQFVERQVQLNHMFSNSLYLKFIELGIGWPYENALTQAREQFGNLTDTELFKQQLPRFRGSIDKIESDGDSIVVEGWGIIGHSQPVRNVCLQCERTIAFAEIESRVERTDVNKLLNVQGKDLGFRATFSRKRLQEAGCLSTSGPVMTYLDFDRRCFAFNTRNIYKDFDFSTP